MARYTIDGQAYDTSKMQDLGIHTLESHGVKITGVYLMPRARRVIVETYSIWQDHNNRGCCIGARAHIADTDEIAALAQEHDCDELYALLPEAEDVAPTPDYSTELRGIRESLALTQSQLADKLGISSTQVARIERGESGVSEPVIRLARILAKT